LQVAAVLLDAAGTLIRTREPVGETYSRIAREHGVAIPAWRLDEAFARVLRSAPPMPPGPDDAERAWWRDVVRATFRAADQMQRFADFEACFAALYDHFARPDAWRAKPDPAFFARACAHLGVAPAAAVAVGDDPIDDLAAAQRAGLTAIDVATLASLAALPARILALEAEEDR